MKKGKKPNKRKEAKGKKEAERKEARGPETEPSRPPPLKQFQLSALFKNDELHEVRNLSKINDLTDSHVLLAAVVLGKFDIVKKMLKEGLPIDICGEDGMTALMWSVRQMQFEMVDFLINRGASLTHADAEGNTAALIALQTEAWDQDAFIDLWNNIKDRDMDLNHHNKMGNSLIHYVVRRQWQHVLQLIIEKGVNLNSLTSKGVTSLMLACSKHHEPLVQCLLKNKADVTIEDQKGCTALCYSIAYTVQKKIVRNDGTVHLIMIAAFSPDTKQAKVNYIKRRIDLLCNPPDTSTYHQTMSNVLTHVFTFIVRFIDRGVDCLLDYSVFRKIKESIEKHMENMEYIGGLLSILGELVRHCDCCTSNLNRHKVLSAFHEVGLLSSCLKILKRYPETLLEPVFIILIHTCWNQMTKLWLQNNFRVLSEHYTNYLQNCIPVYNFYPDDAHNQIVRKNSQTFKNLCTSLMRGEIIAQEPEKPKVKKSKKELRPSKAKEGSVQQTRESPGEKNSSSGPILISGILRRQSPQKIESEKEQGVYWTGTKAKKEESDDEHRVVYPRWQEDFREGCELFGIPIEPVKMSENVWEEEEKARQPSEDVEDTITGLDKLFNNIMDKYNSSWQRDYEAGYPGATSNMDDYLRLMRTLPYLENYHEEEAKKKWETLSQTLKDYWKEHRTAAQLPLDNVKAFLKVFEETIDSHVEDTVFSERHETPKSLFFQRISKEGIDTFKADYGEVIPGEGDSLNTAKLTDQNNKQTTPEEEKNANNCRLQQKPYKRKISPPPGFEECPKKQQSLESVQRDRVNLYHSEHFKERIETLRALLSESPRDGDEDIHFPPEDLQIHYTVGDGGNFGRVILGLDKDFYPVAIKQVLRTESLSSQLLAANLMHCLREILDVQNEHLLPYTVLCDLKGEAVFATPLCQRNLDTHMRQLISAGKYTSDVVREMTNQVVKGLHFLHTYDSPIIHGNLKPSNVLVDSCGNLRLADFGLSQVLYHLKYPTLSSFMWWSQESINHFQIKYQYVAKLPSDIQVCGMLIHYIMTGGSHPFGNYVEEIVSGIMKGHSRVATPDPNLRDLLSWMLNHLPEERPKIDMVHRHIALWSRNKVLQFLQTCMGEQGFSKSDSSLAEFHKALDQYTKDNGIDTQWIERVKEEWPGGLKRGATHYPDTLSGMLLMCRSELPHSLDWLLLLFPTLPLYIHRILFNTRWSTRPQFLPYM